MSNNPQEESLKQLRSQLLQTAQTMANLGLVRASSGNVSARFGEGFLITASGIPYDELVLNQIIEINYEGEKRSGTGVPSSEWRMHAAIYERRRDVRAIVHTHSPYATSVAIARSTLPIVHDEGRILFGKEIPVASHTSPGTWELATAAAEALGTGNAILLSDHGAVAVGQTPPKALTLAEKIEEMAQLFWLSLFIKEKDEHRS